jgi:hypothetical protein
VTANSPDKKTTSESGNDHVPDKIDVGGAEVVTPPQAPPVTLDPLAQAGVDLARWVLSIIASVLAALFILAAIDEFYTPQFIRDAYGKAISASLADNKSQAPISSQPMISADVILNKVFDARAAARDFWLKLAQLVLLNLLLPVLTAILGYTFGSKQASKST